MLLLRIEIQRWGGMGRGTRDFCIEQPKPTPPRVFSTAGGVRHTPPIVLSTAGVVKGAFARWAASALPIEKRIRAPLNNNVSQNAPPYVLTNLTTHSAIKKPLAFSALTPYNHIIA